MGYAGNWIAPGVDMIHAFWWKRFTLLHEHLPGQLHASCFGGSFANLNGARYN